jgi:AcrR family transcriptional regulator
MAAMGTKAPGSRPRVSSRDRRREIVQVAKELFAHYGFQGTTTREIAKRAGVNEAILFRLFRSKQGLYWKMIEYECELCGEREYLENLLTSAANHREVLIGIARRLFERSIKDSNFDRLLLFSSLEKNRGAQRLFQAYIATYSDKLADYIRDRIVAGAFRPINSTVAARNFLGAIMYQSLLHNLFGVTRFGAMNGSQLSEAVTDMWLDGIAVRQARPEGHPGDADQVDT